MKNLTIALALIVMVASAGCQRTMDIPTDFVPAYSGAHPVWAVSADGVVVALRKPYENPKNGTLEFWAKAAKNELTDRGYKLASDEEIISESGLAGRLLSFSAEKKGVAFSYLLAVYVHRGEVLIAEAGGKAEAVKPKTEDIKNALFSVR